MSRSDATACASMPATFAFVLWSCWAPPAVAQGPECAAPVARIVSIQGSVELQRAGTPQWLPATRLDTPLCDGDRLQTGRHSRAALVISPETLVRVDQNSGLAISVRPEETVVELFTDPAAPREVLGNACGAGYFISRFPRKFRVRTPFLNAAVEGTEFVVAHSCDAASVSVFEGRVAAQHPTAGGAALAVNAGETVSGDAVGAGAVRLIVKPVDAVQWALYYPPLATSPVAPDEPCDQDAAADRAACLVNRAEQRLRVGRVDDATADLAGADTLQPGNGDVQALRSIIALTKNDRDRAQTLAREATELAPGSPRAWLARSYAQQAAFDLEVALASARRAAGLAEGNALVRARVAELLLALGRTAQAQREAQTAVATDARAARAHVILGFIQLARIEISAARGSFLRGIELDQADPLARLGLGLAMIRDGRLTQGREQIEIAIALDPANALLRSYMGKAYFEENTPARDGLAATQFELAKSLDPRDPTPWYYDAILKQTQNRPVEALDDLRESIARNDDRAVYRSRLLLDQDAAAREASLARAFDDVGFQQLGVLAATDALGQDPTNASAHRLLADIYAQTPRYDIARVSESLQSQLLQPLSLTPVQPSLVTRDLNILRASGPTQVGLNEFNPLFERDALRFNGSAVVGNNDTIGDEVVFSGLKRRFAFALGQYHYETAGFRPNNDYEDDILSAFGQLAIGPALTAQVELRTRQTEQGDLTLDFDPTRFSTQNRLDVDHDSQRLGARLDLSPASTVLLSVIHHDRRETQDAFDVVNTTAIADDDGYQYEGQWLWRHERANLVLGAGYYEIDASRYVNLDFTPLFGVACPFPPCDSRVDFIRRRQNAYGYFNFMPHRQTLLTIGVSAEDYKDGRYDRQVANPKLGLEVEFAPGVRVRAAGLRTLKPARVVDQTLKPTQVAGFNQFFDDFNGTLAERYYLGFDLQPTRRLALGAVGSSGHLSKPILTQENELLFKESFGEHVYGGYAFLTLSKRTTLTARFEWEELTRKGDAFPDDPIYLLTRSAPVSLRYFAPSGWFATLGATWVRQTVERLPASTLASGKSDFTLVDAALGYWLPSRRGQISIEARNLFDQQFNYQDVNFQTSEPRSPRFLPERSVFVRLTVSF